MRIERLKEFIAEKELDGVLITHKPNLFYFTGSAPVLGSYLVVTADEELFLVPQLEYEEARESSRVPVEYFKRGAELYERLKAFNLKKLGIEGGRATPVSRALRKRLALRSLPSLTTSSRSSEWLRLQRRLRS